MLPSAALKMPVFCEFYPSQNMPKNVLRITEAPVTASVAVLRN
jgi:hypothetical protein